MFRARALLLGFTCKLFIVSPWLLWIESHCELNERNLSFLRLLSIRFVRPAIIHVGVKYNMQHFFVNRVKCDTGHMTQLLTIWSWHNGKRLILQREYEEVGKIREIPEDGNNNKLCNSSVPCRIKAVKLQASITIHALHSQFFVYKCYHETMNYEWWWKSAWYGTMTKSQALQDQHWWHNCHSTTNKHILWVYSE